MKMFEEDRCINILHVVEVVATPCKQSERIKIDPRDEYVDKSFWHRLFTGNYDKETIPVFYEGTIHPLFCIGTRKELEEYVQKSKTLQFDENGNVWEKAYLEIHLSNGSIRYARFDTDEAMMEAFKLTQESMDKIKTAIKNLSSVSIQNNN